MLMTAFVFPMPSFAMLIWAWISASSTEPQSGSFWRYRLRKHGVMVATFATAAESAFLFHGSYRLGTFYQGPRGVWLVLSWSAALLWIFAIVTSALGKGGFRLTLLIWAVALFLANYVLITLGTIY